MVGPVKNAFTAKSSDPLGRFFNRLCSAAGSRFPPNAAPGTVNSSPQLTQHTGNTPTSPSRCSGHDRDFIFKWLHHILRKSNLVH
jgi:hypothetical protein